MNLKKSFILAIVLALIGLTIWELYWRTKPEYYRAYLEDDRNLWSEHRAKIEDLTSKDVLLLGMSRTGYNFNTHIWKETQGVKPIHLSMNGKPPRPVIQDIVDNTNFNGTIIMGVVPLGFFGFLNGPREKRAQEWVDHYYNRTYAQKLGFTLSKPFKRHLVMLSASELKSYNDLDLKSLIDRIYIDDGRLPNKPTQLINFGYNDEDRNLIMFPRLNKDSKNRKEITDVWVKFLGGLPEYSEEVEKDAETAIANLKVLVKKFKARGGKIIFIRHKAEYGWNKYTQRMMPKDKIWDKFVDAIDCPTYHFEDYEFMSKHKLPDWSHMYFDDAKTYTRDMVKKLIEDEHLKKYN